MDVLALRDRLVADGVAEVSATYPVGAPEREGALNGFTLCLHLETREQFEELLQRRQRREQQMIPPDDLAAYWRHRYATLQVEWILNGLKAAVWARPGEPVSARAALKAAALLHEGLEAEVAAEQGLDLKQLQEALEQAAELERLGFSRRGYRIKSPYEREPRPGEERAV